MSSLVLPPGVEDDNGYLFFEDDDTSLPTICPLRSLLELLGQVGDERLDLSPHTIADEAAAVFAVPPTVVAITAMRLWPEGLAMVLSAAQCFTHLHGYSRTAAAKAAFKPLAPVLLGWHEDLASSPEEKRAQDWLNRQDWPTIIALAARRDAAARAVVEGKALFDRSPDVVSCRGAAIFALAASGAGHA